MMQNNFLVNSKTKVAQCGALLLLRKIIFKMKAPDSGICLWLNFEALLLSLNSKIRLTFINPFPANIPFLHPLKTTEHWSEVIKHRTENSYFSNFGTDVDHVKTRNRNKYNTNNNKRIEWNGNYIFQWKNSPKFKSIQKSN